MSPSVVLLLLVASGAWSQRPRPPAPSDPGAERFPGVTSCLDTASPSTSCLTCSTTVSVSAAGEDCSRTQRALNGRDCTELEDVIDSIARQETTTMEGTGECIQLFIQPRERPYRVLARENRIIQQSVVLTGMSEVIA